MVNALAVTGYTLAGAALIVDGRTDGGKRLPEGFPLLAELRTVQRVLQALASPPAAAQQDVGTLPGPLGGAPGSASAGPGGPAPEGATGLRPALPTGPSGVRVNRGLP